MVMFIHCGEKTHTHENKRPSMVFYLICLNGLNLNQRIYQIDADGILSPPPPLLLSFQVHIWLAKASFWTYDVSMMMKVMMLTGQLL